MKIFAISDLHLNPNGDKSMEKFGWINHEEKFINNWKKVVSSEDLVLIPGDISWANNLDEIRKDLELIESLPGQKILSKGNHDYYWDTISKLNKLGYNLNFIHNNSIIFGDYEICGSRGWTSPDFPNFKESDLKIYEREIIRLKLSVDSMKTNNKKIAMLHFPPFNIDGELNDLGKIIVDSNIDICIYGHLHGYSHKYAKEGFIGNTIFHCVSSDYINFELKEILK